MTWALLYENEEHPCLEGTDSGEHDLLNSITRASSVLVSVLRLWNADKLFSILKCLSSQFALPRFLRS